TCARTRLNGPWLRLCGPGRGNSPAGAAAFPERARCCRRGGWDDSGEASDLRRKRSPRGNQMTESNPSIPSRSAFVQVKPKIAAFVGSGARGDLPLPLTASSREVTEEIS